MRKLLFLITMFVTLALPAAISFGLGGSVLAAPAAAKPQRAKAPVLLPAALPKPEAAHAGTYGYVKASVIARRLQRAAGTGHGGSNGASTGADSASVVVTATVLPIRTIVVRDGAVAEIWSNTADLRATQSLYTVRDGSLAGPLVLLDAATWSQARTLLLIADEATGRVA